MSTLTKRMGIDALYRKPNTGCKHAPHKSWLYPLCNLKIERSNQVWAPDTTHVPMTCEFVDLKAAVDRASR